MLAALNFKDLYKVSKYTMNDVDCRHLVMRNDCFFEVSRVKMSNGLEQEFYEVATIDLDEANIVAIYNWKNSTRKPLFMDFMIKFEDRAPECIPCSADLHASVSYGEYVMMF